MRSAQCFPTRVNYANRIAPHGISAIDDIARKNPGMAGGRAARSLSIYANSRQAFSLMNCLLEVAQTIAFCRLRSFLLRQATKNDGLSYCRCKACKRAILSSVEGWVENMRMKLWPLNGLMINKCAVAGFTSDIGMRFDQVSSLPSAEISSLGL